jgi:hypothetical protein
VPYIIDKRLGTDEDENNDHYDNGQEIFRLDQTETQIIIQSTPIANYSIKYLQKDPIQAWDRILSLNIAPED